jgi:hypothetical protein
MWHRRLLLLWPSTHHPPTTVSVSPAANDLWEQEPFIDDADVPLDHGTMRVHLRWWQTRRAALLLCRCQRHAMCAQPVHGERAKMRMNRCVPHVLRHQLGLAASVRGVWARVLTAKAVVLWLTSVVPKAVHVSGEITAALKLGKLQFCCYICVVLLQGRSRKQGVHHNVNEPFQRF